jgi:hypothetical protein
MGRSVRRRKDAEDHLVRAGQYRNDAEFQRRLDAFFKRTDGRPAFERLSELWEKYRIGGALRGG